MLFWSTLSPLEGHRPFGASHWAPGLSIDFPVLPDAVVMGHGDLFGHIIATITL